MNKLRTAIVLIASTFSIILLGNTAFANNLVSLMVWEKLVPDTQEGRDFLQKKNWAQDWQELEIYKTKDQRSFLKPTTMKIIPADIGNAAMDKAEIVVFRKKSIVILRYRLLIDGYAFMDFSGKSCFSLQIPAGQNIDLGSALIDEKGISTAPINISLNAQAGSTYYYEFEPGWRKIVLTPISKSKARNYFEDNYTPMTISFDIDWQAFFSGPIKEPFDTRSLDAEGYTSVWPCEKYSVYKPYR